MDWIPYVEGLAVGLAGWAAWLSIPRAPALDWERLFKVSLSVGVWAELEAAATDATSIEAQWRNTLQDAVPYHPAGRLWREKLSGPDAFEVPVPALSGERALLEALSRLDTPEARYDRLFGPTAHATDPAVAESLGDPRTLGDAYDPRRLFGPDADWEAVAAWSPAVQAGLERRLEHIVVLELGLPADRSVGSVLGNVRHHSAHDPSDAPDGGWMALFEAPSDRLVVVLHGSMLRAWLHTLTQSPALVDRGVLIVAVGGAPAADDKERQELTELLESEALLPELQRRTPIAVVDDIHPAHPLVTGMAPIRLDTTDPARLGVRWVDLGPLPVDRVPARPLARALVLTSVFLLAS